MNKILYSGFYGFKNIGDDVFLEVSAWGSKKYGNSNDVVFLAHDLPELKSDFKKLTKPYFKGHDRLLGAKEMLTADYFISAGGSTFTGFKKNSFKYIAEITKTTLNPKLKTGAIGVSIGPFNNSKNERLVLEYLKRMDFLSVRDKRSYEYVKQLNLPYEPIHAFDLAALQPLIYQDYNIDFNKKSSDKKIVGISVCPVESISNKENIHLENERNNRIVDLIYNLNKSSEDILFKFFIINGNDRIGDEKLTREVIESSKVKNYEIIPYYNSVFRSWEAINQCDFMIATRLHAAIIAAFADVPFILNEYHQKCSDFISDIGQDQKFIVGDAIYKIDSLVQDINDVLYHSNYSLKHKIEMQNLAKRNFEFFNY